MTVFRKLFGCFALIGSAGLMFPATQGSAQTFHDVRLVTDDQSANSARITDPNLVNAWGISLSGTSPFWVSANGSGLATLYRVDPVTDQPTTLGLAVHIPGAGNPTGQAFNSSASAFNGDSFLFVSEDGTISGWRGALGTSAETLATGSPGNVYKGAALATVNNHGYLYAANFRNGTVDILKGDTSAPDLTGKFLDPNLPSGFAPFNISHLGDKLYVTYALQDGAKMDDVAGAGNGFVDSYDLQGNLLGRIGTQGKLDSPWGLAIAPGSFGTLAGDLLVGNFGDGTISAFDPNGGGLQGQLLDPNGNPLTIDGLWGLTVGNDGNGGSSGKLYYSAGPDNESHGLFGLIAVPEASSTFYLLLTGLSSLVVFSRKMRS